MKKKVTLKKLEVKSFTTIDIKVGGKALEGTHYESICDCKSINYSCEKQFQ